MDSLETRRFEMFRRVRDFGTAHASDFPAQTLGNELFNIVKNVVTELDNQATNQSSGLNTSLEGTATKAVSRAALFDDVAAINRTARSLAYETPGLENKFRLPRRGRDQELLTAARVFAADAAPLVAAFVRHEMPADFLDTLNAHITQFEQALSQQSNGTEARVATTAAIDAAIDRGMTAVRRLDVVVKNKFQDDPATLAGWATASHTERTARAAAAGSGEQPPGPVEPPMP